MRAIILAAGNDNMLDGMIKCLIRHPADGQTVLEHLARAFSGMEITVVAGYRAIEIIERYPKFNYVINRDWAITNNAYSLALALDDSPCFVISGDMFIDKKTVAALDAQKDMALSSRRENRGLSAINASINNGIITETYMGILRDPADEELLGLFKISSPDILRAWKKFGFAHSNLFCGQTLPVSGKFPPVRPALLPDGAFYHEINTVDDYLRLVRQCVNLPK